MHLNVDVTVTTEYVPLRNIITVTNYFGNTCNTVNFNAYIVV